MNLGFYDVAIIGAGPNGLTAAAYLARAGASVVVLEARFERGGTLASDDYSTPFTYNLAQLLVPCGGDSPPCRDLGLAEHAVAFIDPAVAFATALDGDELVVERGGRGLGGEVEAMLAEAEEMVAPLLYTPASALHENGHVPEPRLARITPSELAGAADDERATVILRYACGLAGFPGADEPLGVIGSLCLARLFAPTLVAGGSKSLANGLFRVAARAGARCLTSARVVGLDPGDTAVEVTLADRRTLAARAVISTLDPVTTFIGLLSPDRANGELTHVAEEWTFDPAGSFTAHFGVKGSPPGFHGSADAAVRVLGFGSAADVAEHLDAVAAGSLPRRPAGHLTPTSALDPLQASPGPYGPLYTLRYEPPAPYAHPAEPWDRARAGYRDRCWELVREQATGLDDALVLFRFADSPRDLEVRFGTTHRGSIRQGSLRSEQTLSRRPHPSCPDGRTPIPGLYLGGGSVHPGVPGSLGGGYNTAGVVCADLGLDRWW
jgi:phytoene dehydrogenase-like protein